MELDELKPPLELAMPQIYVNVSAVLFLKSWFTVWCVIIALFITKNEMDDFTMVQMFCVLNIMALQSSSSSSLDHCSGGKNRKED